MQQSVLITHSGNDMSRTKLVGITANRNFYLKHKDDRKREIGDWYRRTRATVLELLGNECLNCGFKDSRALQIDHVNGGGVQDKKKITRSYHVVVIESIMKKENKYQLLCANCNWIKRYEKGEVRRGPLWQ